MLFSLWLVPGRFFRPEYMIDRVLLLLAVLKVRLALLWVGADALAPTATRDCLVGASAGAAASVVLRADDDATSKSSSSSVRSVGEVPYFIQAKKTSGQ